ncbi:MAG: hypothetical protein WBL95_22020 [Microcoleus sp.]
MKVYHFFAIIATGKEKRHTLQGTHGFLAINSKVRRLLPSASFN